MKKQKFRKNRPYVKSILAIIAMFACTSICLGEHTTTINSDLTYDGGDGQRLAPPVAGNSDKANGTVNDDGIFPLDPNKCTLIIDEGASVGGTSGARIGAGSAFRSMTYNKVIVNGGNFNDSRIRGALSLSGGDVDVKDNTVEINAGNGIRGVHGGFTRNGTASGNKVFIKNKVTIERFVNGGCVASNGNAKNNEVTITDATVKGNVFGGYVYDNGSAINNTVSISGGKIGYDDDIDSGNVYGGRASNETASGNKVFIKNKATIGGYVIGGFVFGNGNAKNNEVTITDATVNMNVLGGYVNDNGSAINNTVSISGGKIGNDDDIDSGNVYGGRASNGTASSNKVFIKNEATIGGLVIGGGVNGNGNAESNEVTITDATANKDVYGGVVIGNGDAKDNKVTIDGGIVKRDVYGGTVVGNGNATGNKVFIKNKVTIVALFFINTLLPEAVSLDARPP
ncbi:hypothetical protein AGMMS49593_08760 [Endomicrobiia bacterium]|nr:hypothetical protein AGMMS49593_08760 [Endomicrobiia bacterium]